MELDVLSAHSKTQDPNLNVVQPLGHSPNSHESIDVVLHPEAESSSHNVEHQADLRKQHVRSAVQLFTICWTMFLGGWNDGSSGPLIPRIQEVYKVGYTLVSLMFVFGAVGFIAGAAINVPLTNKLGFGKCIFFASILPIIGYAIQASAPPFPAFIAALAISGIGLSIQNAQAIGYAASLTENNDLKMGVVGACYGFGAFFAPLISTRFSQLSHWSFHYLVSLGLALCHTILVAAVFRFKNQDECHIQIGQAVGDKGSSDHSAFRQILGIRAVHVLAIFLFVYIGTEVTIGGWIVTYAINVRGGGPNAGYISSGFFAGLAVGRLVFLWVNRKVGERRVLFIYVLAAIGLELVVWLVPSLVGSGVAISLVGLVLGPMFPITMQHASRILPQWLLTGSIGWITGIGTAGSAVLPFITGSIASKHGITSLQPFLVSMMALLMVLWALVPAKAPKRD